MATAVTNEGGDLPNGDRSDEGNFRKLEQWLLLMSSVSEDGESSHIQSLQAAVLAVIAS